MAPLALFAAVVAVGLVVRSATDPGGATSQSSSSSKQSGGASTSTTEQTSTSASTTTPADAAPRSYTVKAGDTLGTIAEQAGVTVEQLQELNPELDPQSLTVGQRIRLRR